MQVIWSKFIALWTFILVLIKVKIDEKDKEEYYISLNDLISTCNLNKNENKVKAYAHSKSRNKGLVIHDCMLFVSPRLTFDILQKFDKDWDSKATNLLLGGSTDQSQQKSPLLIALDKIGGKKTKKSTSKKVKKPKKGTYQ